MPQQIPLRTGSGAASGGPPEPPTLSSYIKNLVDRSMTWVSHEVRRIIIDDVINYNRIMSKVEGEKPTGGSLICLPPMHWHPEAVIRIDNHEDMKKAHEAALAYNTDPIVSRKAGKVLAYWTSANTLKLLHRFAHERQPDLFHIPLPDGSNIGVLAGGMALQYEWMLRRAWIRHLHLPGVLQGGSLYADRMAQLGSIYAIGRVLLEVELKWCPPHDTYWEEDDYHVPKDDPDDGHLVDWIKESRNVIRDVLEEINPIVYEEHQTASSRFFPRSQNNSAPPLSKEERLRRNLSPELINIVLDKMINKYEELLAIRPFERLLMDLIEREDAFEHRLTHEHAEDKLLNKQFVVFDELGIMETRDWDIYGVRHSLETADGAGFLMQDFICRIASGIALVNRQRRNFRLMRDWIGRRPWYHLVQIYDSSAPGCEWLAEAIQKFKEKGLDTPCAEDPFRPSDLRNLAFNFFGIHPVDVNHPDIKRWTPIVCALCNTNVKGGLEDSNTLAVLHCADQHMYHIGCIMQYWDKEGRYLYRCPECKFSPKLSHELLGMVKGCDNPIFDTDDPSFVDNAFGYVVHPRDRARGLYDIPDRSTETGNRSKYWQRERALAAAIDDSPLAWGGETITQRVLERKMESRALNRMVSKVGREWRRRNLHVTQAEGYVMPTTYKGAHWEPSKEVAWLRRLRRKRDRQRRERIYKNRAGLWRYDVRNAEA